MKRLNNKKIIITGIAVIILWIITAAATFDRTFIPLKDYISKNSKIILIVSIINKDITKISFLMKEVVFYETYRPEHYRKNVKKYLNALSLVINKTDREYKKLFVLLNSKPSIKLKKVSFTNVRYFSIFAKKSYYHWEYVSKPIVERFVEYNDFVPLKLSDRMFLGYSLDKSILPTYVFIRKISAGFEYLVRFAAFTFIFGTIVIILLGIIVIYYLNKFFGETKKSERRFKAMFENSPVVNLLIDIETGNIIDANRAAEKFYGYAISELKSMNIIDIALSGAEEHRKFRMDAYGRRTGNSTIMILNHMLKSGEVRRVEITIAPIEIEGKECLIDSVKDITERIRYENELKKSAEFFKILSINLPSIIGLYREKIIYMNPFGLSTLGYDEESIKEMNPLDLIDARGEEKVSLMENIRKRLKGESFDEKYTLRLKKKNGEKFWGEIFTTTIFFEHTWTGLVIVTDASDRISNELKLFKEKEIFKELSEIDSLTDIYNRRSFDEKLSDSLNNALLKNTKFSLIMFDIDHFKEINDTFGHLSGDAVLSELASLVKDNIRKDDFVARFGGEEFMIISNNIGIKGAVELAEKIKFKIETNDFSSKINVRCSFGVASFKNGDTTESILGRTDAALYKAKENGRNRVEYE
jgi:diguanylate cyclase (GGDEF)-like protein/PAS domain S-box-containing protein